MTADRENKIRERAYAIWLDQGSIGGRDREHWLEAEKEIAREEAADAPKSGEATANEALYDVQREDRSELWRVVGPNGLVGLYQTEGEAHAEANYLNEQAAEEAEDDF